jgi:N-methylhydantoinase B
MMPDVVLGCLHQIGSMNLPAEGSMMWNPMIGGMRGDPGRQKAWEIYIFHSGGTGARYERDGLSAMAFPSGVRVVPIETIEAVAPLLYRRKELRPDSGGPGRTRGGLGQTIEISTATGDDFTIQAMFDRVDHAARGRDGGLPGELGRISTGNGRPVRSKGLQTVQSDDVLRLELPGGGGFGDPLLRDRSLVEQDLLDGLITPEAARRLYGLSSIASDTAEKSTLANLARAHVRIR